ncbi:hypothetical protein K470DRAFT_259960 [Piedraia hortae CBS 480.64]|uniref:Uncharacterized protein n=1 Tax=Piedraia hortae CBS 480.64 TaxID=1314780 RepID=A0A6A7BSQ4_9PEZI|nr:hypothetical protein K470DRAFT_259960 [Piedraia hortae CBS 480.64]
MAAVSALTMALAAAPVASVTTDVSMTGTASAAAPDRDAENTTMAKEETAPSEGQPLSKGALSGLTSAAAITPAMLAHYYLPGIMLGAGPQPIRFLMGELTHSVPGFSRIPPAKARRIIVAALEGRGCGGLDGSVVFFKTGWGRWDARIKDSPQRDSALGCSCSFNDSHLSPPRRSSNCSDMAFSHADSTMTKSCRCHAEPSKSPSVYNHDDEGMWVPEHEADKMSMDDGSFVIDNAADTDEDATDEELAARSLSKRRSSPPLSTRRLDYNKISRDHARRWGPQPWTCRTSHSGSSARRTILRATPEEHAAATALLSLSM